MRNVLIAKYIRISLSLAVDLGKRIFDHVGQKTPPHNMKFLFAVGPKIV